jgi:hypothetical protein
MSKTKGKPLIDRGGQQARGGAGNVGHILSARFTPGAQHDGPIPARSKAAGRAAKQNKPSAVKVTTYPKNLQSTARAIHNMRKGR